MKLKYKRNLEMFVGNKKQKGIHQLLTPKNICTVKKKKMHLAVSKDIKYVHNV